APIGNSLAHRGPHVYLGSAASNHGLRQRHYDRSHIKAAKAIDSTGSVGAHCTPSETGADLSKHILCVVQNAEELPNIKDEWIDGHDAYDSSCIVRVGEEVNVGDITFRDPVHNGSLAMISREDRSGSEDRAQHQAEHRNL